ncbi:alpha-1 2-mannosidase [Fulvitalea axinellae]|uniref:Alpha-1 2-mannosidase n=1 Tax=Fulvitalea axinellae TaxID=1182444 RepID=A0AAU9CUI8_9BACT|nr:alpha-1 2-mannosidase [Fulvitalea axinellae]
MIKRNFLTRVLAVLAVAGFTACGGADKAENKTEEDVLQYVDPFIGTGFHGHTFPGAVVPFGMVQLSPDTHIMGWDASSGYHYDDSLIYGFSHTHLSGTGIGDMGDVLVLPYTGEIKEKMTSAFDKKTESATPGYYQVTLGDYGVKAELTATTRAGVHRYSYPKGENRRVMFDVSHVLQPNWGHKNSKNTFEIVDDQTIRGLRKSKGWASEHYVYFYAKFEEPFIVLKTKLDGKDYEEDKGEGEAVTLYLDFGKSDKPVVAKVAISPVSEAGAERNLTAEVKDFDFDRVRKEAVRTWDSALSKMRIKTSDTEAKKSFYTALYHSMMAPMVYGDVDGQYRGMDLKVHQTDKFTNYTVFSLWDTFRALHPLMTIIEPERSAEWTESLMLKYEEGGMLPKWPLAGNYTGTMVGYPAISVIADNMAKGLVKLDSKKVLEASLTSAEYNPEKISHLADRMVARVMPRHNYFINKIGYSPADSIGGSVSYGLEHAYYDWCVARICEIVGDKEGQARFDKRAKGYKNYYDPSVGFMRGKNADGSWKTPFSPNYSDHSNGDYIEGNAWQWSWFVPHDVEGYIELMGGPEKFTAKLDELFTTTAKVEGEHASGDITGLIGQYAHGNEPSHHIPYMYNYAGKAWKAQERVDQILKEMYKPTPAGIRGNEDCGQMSAWYVLSSAGFYQVSPGDPTYALGRPLFDEVTFRIKGGEFKVTAENNSSDNKYVQSVTLDGKTLDKPFFKHSDIKAGSELHFVMGPAPKK